MVRAPIRGPASPPCELPRSSLRSRARPTAAGQVAGRPAERRAGGTGPGGDDRDARGELDHALGEDDPQVQRGPPQGGQGALVEVHRGLPEHRQGHASDRPLEVGLVVGVGDRPGGDRHRRAHDARREQPQASRRSKMSATAAGLVRLSAMKRAAELAMPKSAGRRSTPPTPRARAKTPKSSGPSVRAR